MATYVLIHGAASDAWSWHLVEAELRKLGHEVIAPDLPCDDESAGLAEYADTVVAAMSGAPSDVVVVAHSFGGFTAPLVCERVPAGLLVMLQAQVPAPGESPGEWWTASGYGAARAEQDQADAEAGRPGPDDDQTAFALHATPPELAAEAIRHGREQAGAPFELPWPLAAWPDVPTKVLIARDDRFFPAGFMRRLAWERLGIAADEIPGDHVPMLSHPHHVVERLEAYRTEG